MRSGQQPYYYRKAERDARGDFSDFAIILYNSLVGRLPVDPCPIGDGPLPSVGGLVVLEEKRE